MAIVDYPIALAVEDYVPVLLTGLGLWVIARWNGRLVPRWSRPALVGAGLVVAGGLAKASWKLALAVSDGTVDVVLADRALFVLLAPGYLLVTMAVAAGRFAPRVLLVPVGVVVATVLGAGLDWETTRLSLLAVAALSSVVLSVVLAVRSRRAQLTRTAMMFAAHAALVTVLGGLGRIDDPSVGMQWLDQLVNTAAQGLFLVAAVRLARHDPRVADVTRAI